MIDQYETSAQIRLKKARMIVENLGRGGISEIAKRLNKEQNQISQIMGKNPHRSIGDKMAREIEKGLNIPVGWLDNPVEDVGHYRAGFQEIVHSVPIDWEAITQFNQHSMSEIIRCFRVQVETNDMLSTIDAINVPAGSYIVVDADHKPEHQQLIVCQEERDSPVVLRQYLVINKSALAIAANPKIKNALMTLTDNAIIHGVVRQIIKVKTLLP